MRFTHPFRVAFLHLACAVALLFLPTVAGAQGYQLVWSDEFDGSSVNSSNWTFEIGDGCPNLCGWGNNELQYYQSQNATVGGGLLTITAKEESVGGRSYTSARMITKNKADFTYGRMEMRARLPIGQGIWPAFWLLFTDGVYGGWAASGEIDIMEYIGQDPDRVLGTIHFGGPWPGNLYKGYDYFLPSGTFNDGFHEFALEWEPGELRWYVDGNLYACQHDWFSTGGEYPAPFDQDFFIILNMAVGGNLPGSPDGTTVFPQEFVVDYVRVYQKPEFPGCKIVFAGMDDPDPFSSGWFAFNGGVGGGGISANTTSLPPVDGRIASLNSGWGSGGTPGFFGGFGRYNPRDLSGMTHFSFWIDPDSGQDYNLYMQFQDDDDGDNIVPATPDGADDEFEFVVRVAPSGGLVQAGGGWQRVSIPLASLVDDNSYHYGGNGIFDPISTANGGNGLLANVVVTIVSNTGADVTFRTDRWEFTREEGAVTGQVWDDANGDGAKDLGEAGVPGVTIVLRDDNDLLLGSTVTGPSGAYSFAALPSGEMRAEVDTTGVLGNAAPTADPDGVGTPNEAWVTGDCSGTLTDIDFGYQFQQVGVPGDGAGPGSVLRASVPNPFSASTRIAFDLERPTMVNLLIHDLEGRLIRELHRGEIPEGGHAFTWDGRDASGRETASGIYLVSLRTPVAVLTQRVVRLR